MYPMARLQVDVPFCSNQSQIELVVPLGEPELSETCCFAQETFLQLRSYFNRSNYSVQERGDHHVQGDGVLEVPHGPAHLQPQASQL